MLGESEVLVERLWWNVDYLTRGFVDLGFDIGASETPIIPVMIGDEDKAKLFSQKLFERGVFASPIVFPMVPRGTARVRVIVSASFSQGDCDAGLRAVAGRVGPPRAVSGRAGARPGAAPLGLELDALVDNL